MSEHMLWETIDEQKQKIADLEKENVQWKQRNETLKDALEHARKVYGDDLEKSYKEIAELKEKENTVHTLDVLHKEAVRKYGEVNDKLTKAKEIIKEILEEDNYALMLPKEMRLRTEQFLRDSEVEK